MWRLREQLRGTLGVTDGRREITKELPSKSQMTYERSVYYANDLTGKTCQPANPTSCHSSVQRDLCADR